VHPAYGTLANCHDFIAAAHEHGIRVIADLVANHTSDQHPWFLEARSSPRSPKRNYYIWSDSDQKYKEARIIFRDSEPSNWTYDPVAKAYYWHRFFHHQPDRGTIEFLDASDKRVLAYIRQYGEETLLVVNNLSRSILSVILDLQQFCGATPIELIGNTEFPRIGERPYCLSLGPRGFYWFRLVGRAGT
jgi:glycosidase